MLASGGDDVDAPPEASGWWPAFPISDYLAGKVAHPQHDQLLGVGTDGQQWTAGDQHPPADLNNQYEVAKPSKAFDTPGIPSIVITEADTRRPRSTTSSRKFVCDKNGCRTTFQSNKDLRRHTATVHDQLYVRCPRCRKQLKGRDDNLKRHRTRYCKGEVGG